MPDSVSEYMSEGMPGRIICHVECEIEWQNICQKECPVELCPVECKIERQNIYIYREIYIHTCLYQIECLLVGITRRKHFFQGLSLFRGRISTIFFPVRRSG